MTSKVIRSIVCGPYQFDVYADGELTIYSAREGYAQVTPEVQKELIGAKTSNDESTAPNFSKLVKSIVQEAQVETL